MNNHKNLTHAFLFILIIFYIFIKFFSPAIIQNLYDNQSYEILNKFSNIDTHHSINFYLGVIEENITGPLSSALAGSILIILSLLYFKNSSRLTFTLLLTSYLFITKWDVLFFPPYGDPLGGPWVESIWLLHHNFDYGGLLAQPAYASGGPKTYMFSLFPGAMAVLMKICPTPAFFLFVTHSLFFMLAASLIALLRDCLLIIFDKSTALLTALIVLSLPIFQSMTEILNMEMPCAYFAMLTVYFLIHKNLVLASVASILSTSIKTPGIITCVLVVLIGSYLLTQPSQKQNHRKIILALLLTFFFSLLQVYLRQFTHDVIVSHNKFGFLIGWPNVVRGISQTNFILFSLSTLVLIIAFLTPYFRKKKQIWPLSKKHLTASVILIMTALWFALYIHFSVMGHRYKMLLIPFLVPIIVLAAKTICPSKKLLHIGLNLSIILSCYGSYGAYFGPRIESKDYAYGKLERSLEYRNDLRLYMKTAQELEKDYSKFAIGAPFIMAQALAYPELGYVTKPLDIMVYGIDLTYEGIRNFPGLRHLSFPNTIWLGFKSALPEKMIFPIDPRDTIVKDIYYGDKKITFFQGGYAIERIRNIMLYVELQNAVNL